MTRSSRKGHLFEDRVHDILVEHLGCHPDEVRRRIGAETGCDIVLSPALRQRFPYAIEAKKRARIGLYAWMEQAAKNCPAGETPIVICAQDRSKPLVVLRLEDFFRLVKPC